MKFINPFLKILLLLSVMLTSVAYAEKVLLAGTDFKNKPGENIHYYYDKGRSALAIDASKKKFRNVFASAQWLNNKALGKLQVTLTTLSETDGESRYRVMLNGKLVSEFKNPETAIDYQPVEFDVGLIELKPGDTIVVQSMAVTNGKIPEGNGTAFARGRWQSLKLVPVN